MPTLRVFSDLNIPEYATDGAACFDLSSAEDVYLKPKETRLIGTGLYVAVPDVWQMNICSRSGLASRGVVVANSPGVVDSDYRGEVCVVLRNNNDGTVFISKGERIAQAQLNPVYRVYFERVQLHSELGPTARGAGGFGSTG